MRFRRDLRVTVAACAVSLSVGMAACSGDAEAGSPTPTRAETESASPTTPIPTSESPSPDAEKPGPVEPVEFETLVTDLDVPWDLAFLPDGSALVSERETARILHVTEGGDSDEVGTVDDVFAEAGEGGLLGIALEDDWLYAYLTTAEDNRVVRMPFDGSSLGEPEVVIDGIPLGVNRHNGGRIAFGPDGMLYITTGDSDNRDLAQDVDSLAGKILRVTPDGSVPDDNPFDDSPVWSYGHRNSEGLAFDVAGRLWASEFGYETWDELNLIEPGANYGWPEVEGIGGGDEFVDPVQQWTTDEASPSGIAYVRDTIFMAALGGQRLWQIPLTDGDGGEAGEPQDFAEGEYGRMRHAELAPDGTLWVLTGNTDGRNEPGRQPDDDRILRVTLE